MRTAERKMELGLTIPRETLWQSFAIGMRAVSKTFVRVIANRFAANSLADLNDEQLADIGLTRPDLDRALNVGWLDDPTTHLAHAARLRAPERFVKLRRP